MIPIDKFSFIQAIWEGQGQKGIEKEFVCMK
jgi:hypothetical protein